MPTITAISKPKNSSEKFNIYLDGKFSFSLPNIVIVKMNLHEGSELSLEQAGNIIKESEFSLVLDKVLNFLSFRPRSSQEISDYLLKKNIGETTRKMVMEKLIALKLINDEEFTRWWIEQRTNARPTGKRLIGYELSRKGIKREDITQVLSEERGSASEELLAEKLAEKRWPKLKKLPLFEAKNKLFSYLAGKGFEIEVVNAVVAKIAKKE